MHFIKNGFKCFLKTNSTDPRQCVPLTIILIMLIKTGPSVSSFELGDRTDRGSSSCDNVALGSAVGRRGDRN